MKTKMVLSLQDDSLGTAGLLHTGTGKKKCCAVEIFPRIGIFLEMCFCYMVGIFACLQNLLIKHRV